MIGYNYVLIKFKTEDDAQRFMMSFNLKEHNALSQSSEKAPTYTDGPIFKNRGSETNTRGDKQ